MSLTRVDHQEVNSLLDKLKNIKCVLLDVDGILTDGRVIYMGEEVGWNRFFNVYDGHGLKMLRDFGFHLGIISGGDSLGLHKRFVENLGLSEKMCFFGNEDKTGAYDQIKKENNLQDSEICYMGDELFDIPLLTQVGFSATVPESSFLVQKAVDYVTKKSGGKGAGREVMDLIMYAKGLI